MTNKRNVPEDNIRKLVAGTLLKIIYDGVTADNLEDIGPNLEAALRKLGVIVPDLNKQEVLNLLEQKVK